MHAILYRSQARAGTDILALDLNAIIASAERNNPSLGVTGLLLYATMEMVPGIPGSYLQWMEGPEPEVEALFAKVRADRRHSDVEVLGRGSSAALRASHRGVPSHRQGRLFPAWTMGLMRLSELPATLEGFLDFTATWDRKLARKTL